jgi:spore coat polysaccharide biosynthesis predicted glycosyltransferase SpsG
MEKRQILLVCHAGSSAGLGHLSRLLALAQSLRQSDNFRIEFLIFGDNFKKEELEFFKIHRLPISSDFENSLKKIIKKLSPSMVVLDLYPKLLSPNLETLFTWIKEKEIGLVGIDSLVNYISFLDLIWMPTFSFNSKNTLEYKEKLISGWDTLLIQKRLPTREWRAGVRVLVLTGGSDTTKLGKNLPTILDGMLRSDSVIDWVQGPFSESPNIPSKCRLIWNVHNAPSQLDKLIVESDYAITVFGISFFEVLQYGVPTVVFSPYGNKDNSELESLSKEGVAMVASNPELAVERLVEIMNNDGLAKEYSEKALKKISINGAQNLSNKIHSLMEFA